MDGSRHASVCLVQKDGGQAYELPADDFASIDQLVADPATLVWLALTNPAFDDLALLEREFSVHPVALEDVRKRGQRPKLDTYDDQHMLVVYEAIGASSGVDEPADATPGTRLLREIHVFVGMGWMVTIQWGESAAIDRAMGQFERGSGPRSGGMGPVLYGVLDAAADSYFPILDGMAERMDALEDRVLAGDSSPGALSDMLGMKRELLELRRVLAPMRDVANALLRRDIPVVDDATTPYFQDLFDHLVRILDQLDLYRDLLASVVDARLTLTSNALNAIMKRLTAITVILMAPTLIAGIYGMNFTHMPELGWPIGYPLTLGLMALVMVVAFVYFRRHNWF